MKQKTNKLLFSLYYAHMTFLVIKEQNFLLVVRSADVYARKNGESGKCNGTWPNHAPLLPFLCNLVTRAFPVKKCVAPPIF